MTEVLEYLSRHGYFLIFILVFLEGVGLPLPTAPFLLAAGAMSALGFFNIGAVMMVAVAAMVLGDSLMYILGRHTGWFILAALCKISLNPETCMVRSADAFYRRGRLTLLFSKYLPGVNTMAPPLAGSLQMRARQFLGLDLLASLLYIVPFVGLGYLFSEQLSRLSRGVTSVSRTVGVLFAVALAGYVANRLRLMRKDRLYRQVPRIGVPELRAKLEEMGDRVVLADVRSHGYYDPGTRRIKNSIRFEPAAIMERITSLSPDKEIYLYCT